MQFYWLYFRDHSFYSEEQFKEPVHIFVSLLTVDNNSTMLFHYLVPDHSSSVVGLLKEPLHIPVSILTVNTNST